MEIGIEVINIYYLKIFFQRMREHVVTSDMQLVWVEVWEASLGDHLVYWGHLCRDTPVRRYKYSENKSKPDLFLFIYYFLFKNKILCTIELRYFYFQLGTQSNICSMSIVFDIPFQHLWWKCQSPWAVLLVHCHQQRVWPGRNPCVTGDSAHHRTTAKMRSENLYAFIWHCIEFRISYLHALLYTTKLLYVSFCLIYFVIYM